MLGDTFPVYHSDKGKAAQMNVGAKNSHGDILCFLHCDSEIPVTLVPEIRYVMKDHQAGCFGIAFHSKNFFMWTCRVISNHRDQRPESHVRRSGYIRDKRAVL